MIIIQSNLMLVPLIQYMKKAGSKESVRLFIPHYMKDDEYKCPVCKARFWKDYMVCPNCGTKFTGTQEDDGEFMEEMVIWDGEEE